MTQPIKNQLDPSQKMMDFLKLINQIDHLIKKQTTFDGFRQKNCEKSNIAPKKFF